METLRPANYHPVPAIRRHKLKSINGIQQQQQQQQKTVLKPLVSNLARNSPVTKVKKPTTPIVKKPDVIKSDLLSDDDDLYAKLTFDDTEQSLEDEIFEELEKVAHDEAKLNAAIQNFDKILSEYKTKEVKKSTAEIKPSAIPKPLQKSKTCSIIESKCILKKKQEKEEKKVNKPIRVENVESVTHAGYYQLTKSLWNLEDFDKFAKSARHSTSSPAARKSFEGGTLSKAKSVWEVSSTLPPRPSISRQSSISKIPIKSSSNLSTSMLQLNSPATTTTMVVNHQNAIHKLSSKKSSVYASTLGLSSPFTHHQSSSPKVATIRRSSLTAAKSSSSISNYTETKASLQRRNLMNSKAAALNNSKSVLAKSEMSIHGKFAMKAQKSDQQQKKQQQNGNDALLDKCLVKGQELLRKVEEFNDGGSSNATKTSIVVRKRDYVAKSQQNMMKTDVSMNNKKRSSTKNELNAITNTNNETVVIRATSEQDEITAPTLESCNVISEVVLGAESRESIDKLKEDYESDDSGHISNENEEMAMEMKKSPRKISEELLEIFEKKSQQQKLSTTTLSSQTSTAVSKAKVIELNHVNLIKSSMEIYPTCKSEVTIFIKQY